ncbi:GumC family protein [Roseibium sp.]|uniref:GumC family protein n=1 Tax=Roseibium sp. TaxID=1936156 RepID=UPI003B523989
MYRPKDDRRSSTAGKKAKTESANKRRWFSSRKHEFHDEVEDDFAADVEYESFDDPWMINRQERTSVKRKYTRASTHSEGSFRENENVSGVERLYSLADKVADEKADRGSSRHSRGNQSKRSYIVGRYREDRSGSRSNKSANGLRDRSQQQPGATAVRTQSISSDFFSRSIQRMGEIRASDVFWWVWSGKWIVILFAVLGILAALTFALATPPRYTVYTDILIAPINLQVIRDDLIPANPIGDAQLLEVESKMRVLVSRNVLLAVIRKLNLTSDVEFVGKPSWLSFLSSSGRGEGDKELVALRALSERVEVDRAARSFVVTLAVWSEDPNKAVEIANATVEMFQVEQFNTASASAGKVATAIADRLDELRKNVSDAEERVSSYLRQNGLASSREEGVEAQRVAELNNQLVEAQAVFLRAKSLYEAMVAAQNNGSVIQSSVFQSEELINLRAEANTIDLELSSSSQELGPKHPQLTILNAQRRTIQRAIDSEARRLVDAARSEMSQSQATVEELRKELSSERTRVYSQKDASVGLRELERDAEAKASVYEAYLARVQQITEQQQVDTTNIRVISSAYPPKSRSWPPRTVLLLIFGAMVGTAVGVTVAAMYGGWRFLRQRPSI